MVAEPFHRRRLAPVARGIVEVASIIFLFYSNLLMGEFTASSHKKSLAFALQDIFTETNFVIALISAGIGYLAFEFMRRRL